MFLEMIQNAPYDYWVVIYQLNGNNEVEPLHLAGFEQPPSNVDVKNLLNDEKLNDSGVLNDCSFMTLLSRESLIEQFGGAIQRIDELTATPESN